MYSRLALTNRGLTATKYFRGGRCSGYREHCGSVCRFPTAWPTSHPEANRPRTRLPSLLCGQCWSCDQPWPTRHSAFWETGSPCFHSSAWGKMPSPAAPPHLPPPSTAGFRSSGASALSEAEESSGPVRRPNGLQRLGNFGNWCLPQKSWKYVILKNFQR